MSQAGGGVGDESSTGGIGLVYKAGFQKGQRGSGFLSNLWSWVSPLFQSGIQSLGREALKTGTEILADASNAHTSGEMKRTNCTSTYRKP